MRKYWAFFRIGLQNTMAYRGQMIFWLLSNVISVVMMTSLWLTTSAGQSIGGYSKNELITYYIISLFLQWLISWYPMDWIRNSIKTGEIIGSDLVKPLSYFWRAFMSEASWHAISMFLGLISSLAFLFIFKDNFVMLLDAGNSILFALALITSILVVFSFSVCLGLLAFFFTETIMLDDVFWALLGVFGGQVIPLSFFPELFQPLIKLLPFRYMFSFPLEIYFSKLSTPEVIFGFVVSVLWTVALVAAYKLLWTNGLKAYNAWGQ